MLYTNRVSRLREAAALVDYGRCLACTGAELGCTSVQPYGRRPTNHITESPDTADSPVRTGILTRLPCSRRRQICRCPDTPRDSHSIANRTHAGQYAYGHNMAIIRDLEWVVNANTSPTCMWPSTDGNAASGYMRGWAALRLSLTGTGV
jgi:hypothetical protein